MFRCEIDFFQVWGGKIGLPMGTQANNLIEIETGQRVCKNVGVARDPNRFYEYVELGAL
jgi:hypothetical protein